MLETNICVQPTRQVDLRGDPDDSGPLLGHSGVGELWRQTQVLPNGWVKVEGDRGKGYTKTDGWGVCPDENAAPPTAGDNNGAVQERANQEAQAPRVQPVLRRSKNAVQ